MSNAAKNRLTSRTTKQLEALPVNRYGEAQPFTRISFYVGGADYFEWLAERDTGAMKDLRGLFQGLREWLY